MDATLRRLLDAQAIRPTGELMPLGGGDSAAVYALETSQGQVVVKHDKAERLRGEAEGLRALRGACKTLIVPDVLGLDEEWLLLESLNTQPSGPTSDTLLGEGLRELHSAIGEAHGWHEDNACGQTPQSNTLNKDGRVFQRERRLFPLSDACFQHGLIDHALRARIEHIAYQLEEWLPEAPASLLHGDLWSGNVLITTRGPALIDPAVYRHYPDVDIAMLTLFGSPGSGFFDAYWEGSAPADWSRREALFQLYPLLNHLLLFGATYRTGIEQRVALLETCAH